VQKTRSIQIFEQEITEETEEFLDQEILSVLSVSSCSKIVLLIL
jgi:hypothetical protein